MDLHMLGRLDAVALPEIEVSRGGLHVLILVCDRHSRRERTIPDNLSTVNLRPMQLGEILDGSFNIYRRHFGLFMRLSVLLIWLPTAFSIYVQLRFGGNPQTMILFFEEHVASVLLGGLVALVVFTTAGLLLKTGTIRIISDSYLGQEPELGSALRLGIARIVPLLLVTLSKSLLLMLITMVGGFVVVLLALATKIIGAVGGLLAFAGVCALFWFIIYVACAYGVTTPVVVLEDLESSFDAFGRSWDLTRGSRGKLFGIIAVTWLISQFLPGVVVGGMSAAVGVTAGSTAQPIFAVLGSLLGIVLAPILPCALTLAYYDLRVRREAFDIQILSEQLGAR
jgi:hypothetical protein